MHYVDFLFAGQCAGKPFRATRAVLLGVFLSFFLLVGCKDDDGPAANPQDGIRGTWILDGDGYVKKDEVDVSADYAGLTITFSENGTYTSVQAGSLFETSGIWAWQDKGITQLVLDGNLQVFVVGLDDTDLHLQFTLDDSASSGGRPASVAGEYEVKLKASK